MLMPSVVANNVLALTFLKIVCPFVKKNQMLTNHDKVIYFKSFLADRRGKNIRLRDEK